MATGIASTPVLVRQFIANGTITAYRVVKLSSASTDEQARVIAPTATTDQPLGIALEGASDGQPVRVGMIGIFTAEAHGAITAGTLVCIGATTGRISTQAAASGTNQTLLGIALETVTTQGDLLAVFVLPSIMQGQ